MNVSEIDALLIELIMNIIKKEREIEIQRQYINECDEFEPYAIFTRIDRKSKKIIDLNDIINFLEENKLISSEKNTLLIKFLIEFYDYMNKGGLMFEEFLNLIVTKRHSFIRAKATQKQTYLVYKDQFFSEKLENMLLKFFVLNMDFFDFIDSKKINIQCENVDYFELFVMLDSNKNSFIDLEDIDMFLRKRNLVLYEEEILAMLMKYDTDNDNQLNFDEFLRLILPSKHSNNIDTNKYSLMKKKYESLYYQQLKKLEIQNNFNTYSNTHSPTKKKHITNENCLHLKTAINSTENYLTKSTYDKTTLTTLNQLNTTKYLPTLKNNNTEVLLTAHDEMTDYSKDKFLEKLVTELYYQINLDKELEIIKQKLSFLEEFNLISIFKFFDHRQVNYLSLDDVNKGLIKIGVFPKREEVDLIFNKLDKFKTMKIKYSNFIELFIPKNNTCAIMLTNRNHYSLFHNFSNEIKSSLINLFNSFFISESNAQAFKQKNSYNPNFNINQVFTILDRNNNGFITMNELRNAFALFNILIDYEDLLILMDRFDRNKDGKISYYEVNFE